MKRLGLFARAASGQSFQIFLCRVWHHIVLNEICFFSSCSETCRIPGEVFERCSSNCPPTCDQPVSSCDSPCVPSCQCDVGLIYGNSSKLICVRPSQCPSRFAFLLDLLTCTATCLLSKRPGIICLSVSWSSSSFQNNPRNWWHSVSFTDHLLVIYAACLCCSKQEQYSYAFNFLGRGFSLLYFFTVCLGFYYINFVWFSALRPHHLSEILNSEAWHGKFPCLRRKHETGWYHSCSVVTGGWSGSAFWAPPILYPQHKLVHCRSPAWRHWWLHMYSVHWSPVTNCHSPHWSDWYVLSLPWLCIVTSLLSPSPELL